MKITIICVGKLKEKYWKQAVDEYSKRLSKYVKLEIVEVSDEKTPQSASEILENQIKEKEGSKILSVADENSFIVTLEIDGKELSSAELSDFLETKAVHGTSHFTFIIGGSLGLSKSVVAKSHFHLSFSKMTFPHQMMRVILLEQIYRAYKIAKNEPYHK